MHMSFVHTGSYAPVSDIPPPLFHFFSCSLSPIFTPFIIPPKGSQFTVTKRLGYYDNPWALFTTNAGFERSCAGQFNVKCYYVTEEDTSYIIVKQSFKHNHSAVNNSVLDIIYSNYVFLNYLLISLYGILLFSSFTDDAYMLLITKIIH